MGTSQATHDSKNVYDSKYLQTAKMLLDEDPTTPIRHTIENFNIQPDKHAVARVNESLSTLQQARDLRVREAESALKNSNNAQQPSPRNALHSLLRRTRLRNRNSRHTEVPYRESCE